MRNIDKFILHVVHNWKNELNEAYSPKAVERFLTKFREEADDLNISISDEQLKKYINNFDIKKDTFPSDQRDLDKWSVSKFIKAMSAIPGGEAVESEEITPDVVYHNEDNSIVIWNGNKNENCLTYGSGGSWCITRGSWTGHRYSAAQGYPTFYIAKNNNTDADDNRDYNLDFIVIAVRDPYESSKSYVLHPKDNRPHYPPPITFAELTSKVPWLGKIPNIKNILKYQPLSTKEKFTQQYKSSMRASYREWASFPFSTKKEYLVVVGENKSANLFSDITNDDFFRKYLPKFPQIFKFIAETPNVIPIEFMLPSLDTFPNSILKSLMANLFTKIDTRYLTNENISFDTKKYLVKFDKWKLNPNERLYINKEGDTIVKLILEEETGGVKISLYQAEDDFPNIKLNQRTSKYLLDYPELDKIPLKTLLELAKDNIVSSEFINNVLNKAKNDPDSAIVVKETEDGEIILDSNTFISYKIGSNGVITSIPFKDEQVQELFSSVKNNESFQQNIVNLFRRDSIPASIDKKALSDIINSIPYNQRIIPGYDNEDVVILVGDKDNPFFTIRSTPPSDRFITPNGVYNRTGEFRRSTSYMSDEMMSSYLNYLRQINFTFDDNLIRNFLSINYSPEAKRAFVRNNPPVNPNNRFRIATSGEAIYLIDTQNPRESFMLSASRNNLKRANISPTVANQLLGQTLPTPAAGAAAPAAAPAGGAPRRGRPAGVPNAPRQQDNTPPAEGSVGLGNILQRIGASPTMAASPVLQRWPRNWLPGITAGNRGVARRQNIIGGRGRVNQVFESGQSAIYNIRLNNDTNILSVVIQPGNNHFIIVQNTLVRLDSPANLLQALQQRNLAEVHRYIVNEYFDRNPKHISEFKQLLRKHINEKNNQTMTRSKLKEVIRQLVDKVLAEAETAPSKPKPSEKPGPAVAPGQPDEKKEPRRKIGDKDKAPKKTPAKAAMNENEILNKIVARFKSKQ